jgi:hypothetical protein
MLKKMRTDGFSVVGILIVILILAVIGGAGWQVFANNDNTDTNNNPSNNSQQNNEEVPAANKLVLANGSVEFTLPKDWSYTKGDENCMGNVLSDSNCIEGAYVTPGAMLPTKYGNGTEFFNISFSVFEYSGENDPKNWLQYDFSDGGVTNRDIENFTSINGYDTYYRKTINDTYHEIAYVFSGVKKMILIVARTYEPAKLKNGQEVGDFRQFEQPLEDVVNTIKISK